MTKRSLVGTLENYKGRCDECGGTVAVEHLLVHDLDTKDKDGNAVYFALGVVDRARGTFGDRLICPTCGGYVRYIRVYGSISTAENQPDEANS